MMCAPTREIQGSAPAAGFFSRNELATPASARGCIGSLPPLAQVKIKYCAANIVERRKKRPLLLSCRVQNGQIAGRRGRPAVCLVTANARNATRNNVRRVNNLTGRALPIHSNIIYSSPECKCMRSMQAIFEIYQAKILTEKARKMKHTVRLRFLSKHSANPTY